MPAFLNRVQLVGFLGREPKIAYSETGNPVVNLSVATTVTWYDRNNNNKKESRTDWHRIVAWRKLAETCSQFLHRGSQVLVEGRLQTRSYEWKGETRFVTEVIASRIQFLGPPPDRNQDSKQVKMAFELVESPLDETEADIPI